MRQIHLIKNVTLKARKAFSEYLTRDAVLMSVMRISRTYLSLDLKISAIFSAAELSPPIIKTFAPETF